MNLNELRLKNFRNYTNLSFIPNRGLNYLYGLNGSGKTNLLEAIYFLSHLKSFRRATRASMVTRGKENMYLEGEFLQDGEDSPLHLEAAVTNTDRRYKINRKEEPDLVSYLSRVNTVIFFPESLGVVKGGPALRRAFIDRAIAAENPQYLLESREYNRLLLERNQLLKRGGNSDIIVVWQRRLINLAAQVIARRCVFLNSLRTLLHSIRQRMGIAQNMDILYRARGVHGGGESWVDLLADTQCLNVAAASILEKRLSLVVKEERRRGITLWGPHLDDFDFFLGGQKIRESASQGEQRLFMISLVVATAESYRKSQEKNPIILLDDLGSELDAEKTNVVLDYLENMGAQAFVTSTQKPNNQHLHKPHTLYCVDNGAIISQ